MEALLAALAAIWAAVKQYIPHLAAFVAGTKWEQGRKAKEALTDVEEAARATARVELLSSADVMRELERRGLVRMSDIRDEPANRGLDG